MAKVERNASLTYNQLGKTDMVVSNISLGGAAFGEFNRYYFNIKLIATCHYKIYDLAQIFYPAKEMFTSQWNNQKSTRLSIWLLIQVLNK